MGYQPCPKCKGKKDEECSCVKNGKPNRLCEACKGNGKNRCRSCDGVGSVYIGNKP